MNKWMESDWVLRIASVGVAIVFWLIVTHSFPFQKNDQTTIQIDDVQIEKKYNKNQYAIASINDEHVRLTLSGNKADLSSIPPYQVFVDLTELKSGEKQSVPIRVSGLPKNVKVKISPDTTTVSLDEKIHREMPIQIEYRGKLPEGFIVDEAELNPDRVLIKGTEAQLAQLKHVRVVVNYEKEKFPLKKWISLQAVSSQGVMRGVQLSPETAHVSVALKKPSKSLPLTYQIAKQPPEGVVIDQITIEPKDVMVSGPDEELNHLITYPPLQLDLSQVTGNQTLTVPIPPINESVETVPKQAQIKVNIADG